MIQSMPSPPRKFHPPDSLSPSRLGIFWPDVENNEHCKLRALISTHKYPKLVKSPFAIAGSLLHKWVESSWKVETEDELIPLLAQLKMKNSYQILGVSIEQAFSKIQWVRMRNHFLRLAKARIGTHRTKQSQESRPTPTKHQPLSNSGLYSEYLLCSPNPGFKLRGIVDELYVQDDCMTITDFKSGNVILPSGELKPLMEGQLNLYGLIAREHGYKPEVYLQLIGSGSSTRTWMFDDFAEASARKLVEHFQDYLSQELEVDELSKPGPDCWTCNLRHLCFHYQQIAPEWWSDPPEWALEHRWLGIPADLWGTITSIVHKNNMFRIRLLLPNGKLSEIKGLTEEQLQCDDGSHLEKGQTAWFFNLIRNQQNKNSHNFNVSGYKPHQRAWSLTIFYGETNNVDLDSSLKSS
ncbi:MAG: hypothetical protein EP343_32490 [Deltaproteobacteria bacterium]|nr:MAG: hypothetical protein EP343_32490 [Deltaproteobacteria bacterium]